MTIQCDSIERPRQYKVDEMYPIKIALNPNILFKSYIKGNVIPWMIWHACTGDSTPPIVDKWKRSNCCQLPDYYVSNLLLCVIWHYCGYRFHFTLNIIILGSHKYLQASYTQSRKTHSLWLSTLISQIVNGASIIGLFPLHISCIRIHLNHLVKYLLSAPC